ncbi:MAG TPA: MlaD family protein [Gemmatimonadales bacterium]|nr:MlaD family protein [Gemmatimonadales bacterium]
MKRSNEFLVGLLVIAGLAITVAGALWLSETKVGGRANLHTARFGTVGGLEVAAPVTLRGVRIGRIEAIRLVKDGWVEADLRINPNVDLPAQPIVIGTASSLFGEWELTILSADQAPADPTVRQMLHDAAGPGGSAWPGATLPDVGQLTAQASRIASDIAALTGRVQNVFDSAAVIELRQSIKDFGAVTDRLAQFTNTQTARLNRVGGNLETGSESFTTAAASARDVLARIDSSTKNGRLNTIVSNADSTSADVRQAAADLRSLMAAANSSQANLVHVLQVTDSLLTRIQSGQGTLGRLSSDSALYVETTNTVRELHSLIQDIRANPRRFFSFSVF